MDKQKHKSMLYYLKINQQYEQKYKLEEDNMKDILYKYYLQTYKLNQHIVLHIFWSVNLHKKLEMKGTLPHIYEFELQLYYKQQHNNYLYIIINISFENHQHKGQVIMDIN